MARKLRIEYKGAWYHVMNRGAKKQRIYNNDDHRRAFLTLLGDLNDKYFVETHAYCLMDNHYHLLLHTPLGNLSRAMRHLDGVYTQRYNRSYAVDGSLFRGRFHSILIQSEKYLLNVSRYIHLNPVEAKMVDSPEKYNWSSCQFYNVNEYTRPYWLYCDEVFSYFEKNNAIAAYQSFVNEGIDEEIEEFYSNKISVPILGDEEFINKICNEKLNPTVDINEIPQQKRAMLKTIPDVDTMIKLVANHYNADVEKLRKVKNKIHDIPRYVAIYLAVRIGQMTFKKASEYFGEITYSATSRAVNRIEALMLHDDKLKNDVTDLINKINNV